MENNTKPLYDDVRNVPKGSIKPYDQTAPIDEHIVRGMWIDSIKFHREEPICKPVIGRIDVETVKTVCTIVLVGDGIHDMTKDGIPTNEDGEDIRPLEIGRAGEREVVVVQGVSVCRSMEDYIEEFEKEDAYAMAMNKLAQLKIQILGFVNHEHTSEDDLIVEDNTTDDRAEIGTGVDPMHTPVETWGMDGIEVAPDPEG